MYCARAFIVCTYARSKTCYASLRPVNRQADNRPLPRRRRARTDRKIENPRAERSNLIVAVTTGTTRYSGFNATAVRRAVSPRINGTVTPARGLCPRRTRTSAGQTCRRENTFSASRANAVKFTTDSIYETSYLDGKQAGTDGRREYCRSRRNEIYFLFLTRTAVASLFSKTCIQSRASCNQQNFKLV